MIIPELPKNEEERLESLLSHEFEAVYNSDEFNFLTDLAAQVSGCEVSLISLVYEDKQWFLSHHGLAVSETPRDYAFCAHAIINPKEVFTIENALDDERFRENPLVVGEPYIRFYSGIPILDNSGLPLGTLCVIDSTPKQLSQNQQDSLKRIANQVKKLFDLQKLRVEEKERAHQSQLNALLLENAQEISRIGAWKLDLNTNKISWTDMVFKIHEVDKTFEPDLENGIAFYHEDDREVIREALRKCIEQSMSYSVQCRIITAKGSVIWVRSSGKNNGEYLVGSFQDITQIKQAEKEIRSLLELTQEHNERLYNFARIVSHNLKNHSDGIIGILELLREQNPELGNNKFLNFFEKSAKNLVQTIQVLTEEKLLNSKLGNLPLEFVNISELIEKNTLSVRGDLITSAYKIDNLVDSELEIRGVHAYLDSIVLNLITNAIKYRRPNVAGVLKIWNDFREGYIVLNFQDNGLGIDLEQYGNELFGLHKTFHGNIDSRGIGLYISKNQIEQMGGKIEVESKVDEGTVFRVFLRRN